MGVAIGMLFAPKSGQETRDFIKNKTGEGTDYLKQRSTEFRQSAAEWVDKGQGSAAARQKDNLSDAVEAGKQAYREAVSGQLPGPRRNSVARRRIARHDAMNYFDGWWRRAWPRLPGDGGSGDCAGDACPCHAQDRRQAEPCPRRSIADRVKR